MALTIVVITRNAPVATDLCLRSLLACSNVLAERGGELQFVLLDDCSDAASDPSRLFPAFRAQTHWPVRAMRFRSRVHYSAALAQGMSLAAGGDVLFVSHDMILTRDCALELFDVCDAQPTFGVFRPRSRKMDFAEKMTLAPPEAVVGQEDAERFAAEARREFKGQVVGWPILIGDALLIRRAVIDKIGVLDTRFYGYWADIDYGVRVQRAGWRHGIAAGAWLHHWGGASGHETAPPPEEAKRLHEEMLAHSNAAYQAFREKWGAHLLPERRNEIDAQHLRALRNAPAPAAGDYQPPLTVTDAIADLI
jgi:GT2 family glycosyltransferase